MICAALWPDPADENCPKAFREAAVVILREFAKRVNSAKISEESNKLQQTVSEESRGRWEATAKDEGGRMKDESGDDSSSSFSLPPSSFFEALPRPLVVDPFCGGGSIPLEALRVGADAFASDLNPVPVLLNKVVLEYIPKYGKRLAEEVRKWGAWIKKEAEKELAEFYPKDPDGATPIAYLWARTIKCEGPACGAEVPLIRSLWLAKKANRSVALQLVPNPQAKRVDFQIIVKQRDDWVDQADLKPDSSDNRQTGGRKPQR